MSEACEIGGPYTFDDCFNLVVIQRGSDIALGRKTRGYGEGDLVLPGGKDQYYITGNGFLRAPGAVDAAREVQEETGLSDLLALPMDWAGTLHVEDEEAETRTIGLYRGNCPEQVEMCSSAELQDVGWYSRDALPYADMPADYPLWLPHVLGGGVVMAFLYTENGAVKDGDISIGYPDIPGCRGDLVTVGRGYRHQLPEPQH